MATPTVFGAAYSVYVRIVRLALEEKGVAYRLEDVDIFSKHGPPAGYEKRHPFLRIPAFEHDGFRLYEAGAITRYIDAAFTGPALMPATPRGRARADQIIGILDSYAYRTWVWDIYVERTKPAPDEAKIAEALPRAETCLTAVAALMEGETFFFGDAPTLADLHAAPMIDLFQGTSDGARLLANHPRWRSWWATMSDRPSWAATAA
ncbi:MAG: glutathione S-transferase family protein [Proteobacteria bacterium]|nr:glutathione S-transferase family protein [Pseudomonadota bacterium]